jgi:hypothetical protein
MFYPLRMWRNDYEMLVGSEFEIEIFTDIPAPVWKTEKLNAV